jgi:hypothetical protein
MRHMNQMPGVTRSQPKGSMYPITIALVLIILVLLVVVAVLSNTKQQKHVLNPLSGGSIKYGPPPQGMLIMTVARSGVSPEQLAAAVYDLNTKKLSYLPTSQPQGAPQSPTLAMEHSFSSNLNYATFVGADNAAGTKSPLVPTQIFSSDLSVASSSQDFISALQHAKSVTTGSLVRLAPSVSDKNEIVYFAHTNADPATLVKMDANQWDIHLVSTPGSDKVLTSGIYPKWVGTDQFVFLKNDGLYLYSLVSKSEKKVWASQGSTTISMSLSVSRDFHHVAWMVPAVKGVLVFQATDWSSGELQLTGPLHLMASGIAFSPDSTLLDVQSPLRAGGSGGGVVETFFNVENLQLASAPYRIPDLDQKLSFLTDWVF